MLNETQLDGIKIKIEYNGSVKICRAQNLYGLLSKINEKIDEIHGHNFRIEYFDGSDKISITKNDDFEEACAEATEKIVPKFFILEDKNGPFNLLQFSYSDMANQPKITTATPIPSSF